VLWEAAVIKLRRYVVMRDVELIVRLTPASVREHLLAIVETAAWNAANSELAGSPQQKEQEVFASVLKAAAQEIESECAKHWKEHYEPDN
jgi:hypothetical protein